MGTVHACHQVNQLRPLHFVTPLLVIPRESESGTMLVSTAFYFLSERPCLFKRPSTDPSIHGGPRHRVHARSPRQASLHRTYTARLKGATRAVYGVVHGVVQGAVYTWLLLLGLHGPDICGVLQLVSVCWLLFCTVGCNCLFPCSLCS
jgi:hypothetical protein